MAVTSSAQIAAVENSHLDLLRREDDTPFLAFHSELKTGRPESEDITPIQKRLSSRLSIDLLPLDAWTPFDAIRARPVGDREFVPTTEVSEDRGQALPTPDVEDAARTRLVFLARSYVKGALSTEETARLEILSQRLRQLVPRFTSSNQRALEQVVGDIEQFADSREKRRAERESSEQ